MRLEWEDQMARERKEEVRGEQRGTAKIKGHFWGHMKTYICFLIIYIYEGDLSEIPK